MSKKRRHPWGVVIAVMIARIDPETGVPDPEETKCIRIARAPSPELLLQRLVRHYRRMGMRNRGREYITIDDVWFPEGEQVTLHDILTTFTTRVEISLDCYRRPTVDRALGLV